MDVTEERTDGPLGAPERLTVDLDAWPLSLDPYHVVDFNQAVVLDALVDPLTREDPTGVRVAEPSALAALDCLDDGRTWLLTPAPGQCWTDGTPVRAEELAAGIHRAWSPTGLDLPTGYGPADGSPVRTRVTGGGAVELCSPFPLPFLPELLAFPGAAPVREQGGGWSASGPYRPWRVDRAQGRIELRRKPSRRTCPESAHSVVFQVHTERADALAAFEDGRVDISLNTGLQPDDFARLAASPQATVRPLAMACQLWVRPGVGSPLETAAGRREFSAGFDREAVSAGLLGAALPLRRYRDLWEPSAPDRSAPPTGPRSAPPGAARGRRPELTLSYADFPPNDRVVQALARDIEARFGHRIRPLALPYDRFAAAVAALDYDLLYCINPAPLAHVAGLVTQFHSGARTGRALGLQDAAVDAALDHALRDGGAGAWREAEETVLDRAPVVPLFQVNSVTLHRPGLSPPLVAATGAIRLERVSRSVLPDSRNQKVPA